MKFIHNRYRVATSSKLERVRAFGSPRNDLTTGILPIKVLRTSQIVGTMDLIFWLWILVAMVDYLWLRVNFIGTLTPLQDQKLSIGFDILIAGLMLRVMIILATIVAGGHQKGFMALMDWTFDGWDAVVFGGTLSVTIVAIIIINAVTPGVSHFFSEATGAFTPAMVVVGAVMGPLSARFRGQVAKLKAQLRITSTAKDAQRFFGLVIIPAIMALPVGATITYSVTPTSDKFFGLLIGTSEETFFRGALLPIFVIMLYQFLPLWLAMAVGALSDETLFAFFHGYIYGNDPTTVWIVFLSGLLLASAYLSGPLLGRHARLSANITGHDVINWLSS